MLKVVTLYAGLLGLFYVYLSVRTISIRRKAQISIGDGGDQEMLRAIRMHANFAEYTPLALVLLVLMELQNSPSGLLHALGCLLVLARVAHAYGISSVQAPGKFRVGGMAGTFTTLVISSLWLVSGYLGLV